jgi:hypothetical protein
MEFFNANQRKGNLEYMLKDWKRSKWRGIHCYKI